MGEVDWVVVAVFVGEGFVLAAVAVVDEGGVGGGGTNLVGGIGIWDCGCGAAAGWPLSGGAGAAAAAGGGGAVGVRGGVGRKTVVRQIGPWKKYNLF